MEHRNSSPTPEKQLLKLIEQPGAADQHKETLKRRGIALLSPSVIRGKLSFFKEKTRKYLAAKKKAPLGVKGMNRILAFCTLVIAVYLAMDIIGAIGELYEPIALGSEAWEVKDMYHVSSEGKLHYVEKVGLRNVFSFKSQERPAENIVGLSVSKTQEQMMLELMKDLEYEGMGVWPGEAPEAYIRDKEEAKSYTKKIGEKIRGLEVIEILENKVILRYGEVKLPLSL